MPTLCPLFAERPVLGVNAKIARSPSSVSVGNRAPSRVHPSASRSRINCTYTRVPSSTGFPARMSRSTKICRAEGALQNADTSLSCPLLALLETSLGETTTATSREGCCRPELTDGCPFAHPQSRRSKADLRNASHNRRTSPRERCVSSQSGPVDGCGRRLRTQKRLTTR